MAKRKSSLVCQYLENISRKMLEEYQDIIKAFVRNRHGVYALYRGDKLYYVGLAGSLLTRLKQHLKDHHQNTWDRFSIYLTLDSSYMKEIESVLIRIAHPPGNRVKGKFSHCENMLREIKRAYHTKRQEEESEIFGVRSSRKAKREMKRTAKTMDEKRPVFAPYAEKVTKLRREYKGKMYKAQVMKNGMIRLNGKRYNSPSSAAKSVTKHATDGWHFWTYERAPGDWVKIDELRN
jgi:hypothetical protein